MTSTWNYDWLATNTRIETSIYLESRVELQRVEDWDVAVDDQNWDEHHADHDEVVLGAVEVDLGGHTQERDSWHVAGSRKRQSESGN